MPGRPYWSGQLKISLVSFSVQLYPASVSRSGVAFHLLDRHSGERIRHLNVVGDSDHPVEDRDIVKGYEYRKGKYLTIEPEEIAKLRIETNKVIEIKQFVETKELPPALFEKPYFVVPGAKDSREAFAVVQKAMAEAGKAAIGEVAFGGREHLVAIEAPAESSKLGMMAYLLRYRDEVRASQDYFLPMKDEKIDRKQLAMAGELISKYAAPFSLGDFEDDYEDALRALIAAKQKNEPLPVEPEPRRTAKVVNLMDALRASVNGAKRTAAKSKSGSPASTRGPVLVGGTRRKRRVA